MDANAGMPAGGAVSLALPLRDDLAINWHDLALRQGCRCSACCHWAAPLALAAIVVPGGTTPLSYPQWMVYHWHVVLHQGGIHALVS